MFNSFFTKDELMVLKYLLGTADPEWGDPLKDIYELEQQHHHQVKFPYENLKSVKAKMLPEITQLIEAMPSIWPPKEDE